MHQLFVLLAIKDVANNIIIISTKPPLQLCPYEGIYILMAEK